MYAGHESLHHKPPRACLCAHKSPFHTEISAISTQRRITFYATFVCSRWTRRDSLRLLPPLLEDQRRSQTVPPTLLTDRYRLKYLCKIQLKGLTTAANWLDWCHPSHSLLGMCVHLSVLCLCLTKTSKSTSLSLIHFQIPLLFLLLPSSPYSAVFWNECGRAEAKAGR